MFSDGLPPSSLMPAPSPLDRLHAHVRQSLTLQRFTAFTRVLLAVGFIPPGLKKLRGEPFTVMPTSHPVGYFFDAFFQASELYWFVGFAQVTAALLLLSPRTATLGAVVYFPIILNIAIITNGMGFVGTSSITILMALACAYLLCWDYDRLKALLPTRRTGPRAVGRREYVLWAGLGAVAGVAAGLVATTFHLANLTRFGPTAAALALAGAGFGLVVAWHLRQSSAWDEGAGEASSRTAPSAGVVLGAVALLALSPAASAQAAPDARVYLDRALDLMEAKGYYSSRVDWPSVRSRAHALAADAQTPADTYDAIRQSLAALGDGHSFLYVPGPPAPEALRDDPEPTGPPPPPGWLSRLGGRVVEGEGGGVGYVRVPFFMGASADAVRFADSLAAVIRRVDAARPVGWIVDVRMNGGGNVWPMYAGLAPLLGDGVVGGGVSATGERGWTRIEGPAAVAIAPDTTVEVIRTSADYTYAVTNPFAPVAVLTDSATASSAEAVALAFEGRPRSRRFGAATAGVSSANEGTELADGAVLVVTTDLMTDRTGRAYGVRILPDEGVTDDPETEADEVVEAARAWVVAQGAPACADFVVPYVPGAPRPPEGSFRLRLDSTVGALDYVGARHSTDPADPQFAAIEAAWRGVGPTVAFYEGPLRPGAETAEATIRQTGESGFVRWMAARDSVPVARLEPPPGPEFGAVAEAVGPEPAALFFVLREAVRLRDRAGATGAALDEAVTGLLRQAAPLGLPLSDLGALDTAYARHFDTPADWRDAPAAWFDPGADDGATGGRFMAEANRTSSTFRDRHMATVLAQSVLQGERVFAVVGRDHVPAQAPAIRCLLAAGAPS